MSEYKVIFHIDEMNKWKLLLKNVSNLLDAVSGDEILIKVLANSEAVRYYSSNSSLDIDIKTMETLNKKGVKFTACNNSLNGNGIEKEDIMEFVEIVPVGVLELIKRQREGYSYIKP